MAKKHDETSDLKAFSKIGKVDYGNHTLQASKGSIIGNRTWGRIDFLTHYCGWRFYWIGGGDIVTPYSDEDKPQIKNNNKKLKSPKMKKNG